MSRYSGKCDLCDHIWSRAETDEEAFDKFNGTKLYMYQPLPNDFDFKEAIANKINIPETYYKKIEYSSIKDLIPFYPHLTSFSCGDVICISDETFVDEEERERLKTSLKWLLRIYNRCKRKKIEFNAEDALKEICWNGWNEEPYRELANRVKERGKKTTIDGIHLRMHEHYRQELVDEMLKYGLNPCDYGDYARFLKEDK